MGAGAVEQGAGAVHAEHLAASWDVGVAFIACQPAVQRCSCSLGEAGAQHAAWGPPQSGVRTGSAAVGAWSSPHCSHPHLMQHRMHAYRSDAMHS